MAILPVIGTLTAGKAVLLAAGGLVAYAATRPENQPIPPTPPPAEDPCSSAAVQRYIAQTAVVAGSAGAAAAGVAPAGGVAVANATQMAADPHFAQCLKQGLQHFIQQVDKEKKALCRKADSVVAQLRAKGVAIPGGWNSFSCDQKIAFVAALSTPGLGQIGFAALLAGGLTAGALHAAGQDLQKAVDYVAGHIGGSAGQAVQQAANAVDKAGNYVSSHVGFGGLGHYGYGMPQTVFGFQRR